MERRYPRPTPMHKDYNKPSDHPVPRTRGRQRLRVLRGFWNSLIGSTEVVVEQEDRLSQIEDKLADLGARVSEWEPGQEKTHNA